MYTKVTEDLDIPFSRIGSLTLAFSNEEMEELKITTKSNRKRSHSAFTCERRSIRT